MAQVERETFLKMLTDNVSDESVRLTLLEDFSDSIGNWQGKAESKPVDWESDDNPYKGRYADIYGRYQSRFLEAEAPPQEEKGSAGTPPRKKVEEFDVFEEVKEEM